MSHYAFLGNQNYLDILVMVWLIPTFKMLEKYKVRMIHETAGWAWLSTKSHFTIYCTTFVKLFICILRYISSSTFFYIYFQDRLFLPEYPVDGKYQQQSILWAHYSVQKSCRVLNRKVVECWIEKAKLQSMADHNGAAANTSENRSLLPSQPQSYCTAALKVTVITISQIILNGFCAMNDKKVWPILFNLRTKLRPPIQDLWSDETEFMSWINGSFVFVTSCQVYATWIVIVNSCQAGERSRCIGNSIWRQVQCSRYKAEDKVHRFWLEASPSTRTNKILKSLKGV